MIKDYKVGSYYKKNNGDTIKILKVNDFAITIEVIVDKCQWNDGVGAIYEYKFSNWEVFNYHVDYVEFKGYNTPLWKTLNG